MPLEFIAREGFTDAQVKAVEDERKQLKADLLKTPEMVRFKKGEPNSLHWMSSELTQCHRVFQP